MAEKTGIFEVGQAKNQLNIRFSSCMANIDQVCKIVTQFLESQHPGIAPHLFSINLVLREGLTNAVRHGNKNDPDKTVEFHLEIVGEKTIHVKITDQGEGFDWKKQSASGISEEADHGRGIPIMGTYVTRYVYNPKGNILYLEKKISF